MKKRFALAMLLVISLTLVLSGCNSSQPAATPGNTTPTAAKKFPERKIELVVPFGAGGGSDNTARAIAPVLQRELGVPVVINNVSGAGGLKGMNYVYQQPADGYTIMLTTTSHLLSSVSKTAEFDFVKEFRAVGRINHDTAILSVGAKSKFKTAKEMLDFAKANPDAVKMGGTSPKGIDETLIRMVGELYGGAKIKFVPFESASDFKAAILGGHIDGAQDEPLSILPLVQSGDLRPLVVVSDTKIDAFKDAMTTKELGIDLTAGNWRGITVRKGTPDDVVKVLEAAVKKAFDSKEWQDYAKKNMLDLRPGYLNAADFEKLWATDAKFYSDAFKKLGF